MDTTSHGFPGRRTPSFREKIAGHELHDFRKHVDSVDRPRNVRRRYITLVIVFTDMQLKEIGKFWVMVLWICCSLVEDLIDMEDFYLRRYQLDGTRKVPSRT